MVQKYCLLTAAATFQQLKKTKYPTAAVLVWLGRRRTRAYVIYHPICQNKKIEKKEKKIPPLAPLKIDVISLFLLLRNSLLSIYRPRMIRDLRPANSKHNQEFIYKYNYRTPHLVNNKNLPLHHHLCECFRVKYHHGRVSSLINTSSCIFSKRLRL